ncbi:hypothetical protein OF83DRAFT_1286531 [Amylostereum chailletii]|nr:hypothetical protein OF83DRAFT_1286531 [Amylostereum chailletii]
MSAMMDTLSCMPCLQELAIEESLPSAPGFPRRRQSARVYMDCLRRITLDGACSEVAAALQSMSLPKVHSSSLSVMVMHDEPVDALAILKAEISSFLGSPPPGEAFDFLSITGDGSILGIYASRPIGRTSPTR